MIIVLIRIKKKSEPNGMKKKVLQINVVFIFKFTLNEQIQVDQWNHGGGLRST